MPDVRAVTPADAGAWLEMRHALWPDADRSEHAHEIEQFFAGLLSTPLHVLLAFEQDRILGFVEVGVRPYAEGCTTDRVGYLEGWYVLPVARRRGVGTALVEAAERWVAAQGCTELGSDAVEDNRVSQQAHLASGFQEVCRIRCFRKDVALPQSPARRRP